MNNQYNPLPDRLTHRLNLDSDEEEERKQKQRQQQEQYERQIQEKRRRKEEKKKAKEEEERLVKQAAERKAQELKSEVEKYNTLDKLFQPDSDSGVSFTRLKKKIEYMFPKSAKKKTKQQSSESEGEQSNSEEDSESESESRHKKKQKKSAKRTQRKRRERDESESQQGGQRRNKNKSTVKVEQEMTAKDKLVQQVAVRWNYALPQWPPKDFDYNSELKKKGFRAVQFVKFKFVDQVVDGLVKVYELDGYQGVYRGKNGIIDVRSKGECPSLNYFYSKSEEELHQLLKKALAKQIQLLQQLEFKQNGEQKLLEDLKRRQRQLVR